LVVIIILILSLIINNYNITVMGKTVKAGNTKGMPKMPKGGKKGKGC
jgi:hypothetical protein